MCFLSKSQFFTHFTLLFIAIDSFFIPGQKWSFQGNITGLWLFSVHLWPDQFSHMVHISNEYVVRIFLEIPYGSLSWLKRRSKTTFEILNLKDRTPAIRQNWGLREILLNTQQTLFSKKKISEFSTTSAERIILRTYTTAAHRLMPHHSLHHGIVWTGWRIE